MRRFALVVFAILLAGCQTSDHVRFGEYRGLCEGRGHGWKYLTADIYADRYLDVNAAFKCVHVDSTLAHPDSVGDPLHVK